MRFLWLCALLYGLSAWATPGVVAKVEYFYAPDGTLTGRAINGVRQNFEYDLRGQLLAVKDASGKDLERYVYDHVGNILSKTVNGKTTTYTYDKANQLVTSTCDGKTTHYRYDAAGRLVQEGDKKYLYRYQDKVASVWENGQQLANFDYFIDGQVAKATYGAAMEEFLWDDLALIRRGGTTFLNEPYITGGNPVKANDAVMFNDMLGNTLGIQNATGFTPVAMTAFGETADASAFFTGKPNIPELGYAFLFRNYRADQGKWQTIDPLGYPDGWNNLAYVNNSVTTMIDWLGGATRGIHGRSLAGVSGILPYQHSWTSLTLTASEFLALDDKYKSGAYAGAWTQDGAGNMTTKVSAYEENNMLVKKLNDPRDTNSQGLDFYDSMTLDEVKRILSNFDGYNNNAEYKATSQNCNTFTNTINNGFLPATMADPNTIQLFIGIEKTLPKKYFE